MTHVTRLQCLQFLFILLPAESREDKNVAAAEFMSPETQKHYRK